MALGSIFSPSVRWAGQAQWIAACFWQADVKGVINTTTLLGNGAQTTYLAARDPSRSRRIYSLRA